MADKEELLDVLTPAGLRSGLIRSKNQAHQQGLWHATVHLWVCDPQRGLLCQKRAEDKQMNPGLWDFSAAGHIGSGESLLEAAVRELEEETALAVEKNQLNYLGVHISENHYPPALIDREYNQIFGYCGKIDFGTLVPQREEVSELRFVRPKQLLSEWQEEPNRWVSHHPNYYKKLYRFAKRCEAL